MTIYEGLADKHPNNKDIISMFFLIIKYWCSNSGLFWREPDVARLPEHGGDGGGGGRYHRPGRYRVFHNNSIFQLFVQVTSVVLTLCLCRVTAKADYGDFV